MQHWLPGSHECVPVRIHSCDPESTTLPAREPTLLCSRARYSRRRERRWRYERGAQPTTITPCSSRGSPRKQHSLVPTSRTAHPPRCTDLSGALGSRLSATHPTSSLPIPSERHRHSPHVTVQAGGSCHESSGAPSSASAREGRGRVRSPRCSRHIPTRPQRPATTRS